ncbi:MAG: hypothetical protein OEZ34_07720 [Spirochaetia bacterium]|nr:hypothetical protein [Spirochaetia bacterium]
MRKKIFLTLITLFILIPAVLYGIFWVYLESSRPEDKLVFRIENTLNSRAEIRKIKLNPLSLFFFIEIKGLSLNRKDHYSKEKILPDERPPLQNPQFYFEHLKINLDFFDFFKNKVSFTKLKAKGAKIQFSISEGFPEILKPAKTNQDSEHSVLPLQVSHIQDIQLKDSSIVLETGYRDRFLYFSDTELFFHEIHLDTNHLDSKNSLLFEFHADLKISEKNKEKNAGILLNSLIKMDPFLNPETLKINPSFSSDLTVKKNSHFTNPFYMESISQNDSVKKTMDLGFLLRKDSLRENSSLPVIFQYGKIILKEKSVLHFSNYSLTLHEGSFIMYNGSQHKLNGRLQINRRISRRIFTEIDKKAFDEIRKRKIIMKPEDLRKSLLEKHLDQGEIIIDFESTGDIEKSAVRLMPPIPSWNTAFHSAKNK